MNYAVLSYNNSTHSASKYTPFQIVRGKLDYKNPLELSNDQTLSQYMQEHAENIKLISQELHQKLTSQQQSSLDKMNKNRNVVNIDPNKPLYAKTFPQKSKVKELDKYKKIDKPIVEKSNVITTQKRQLHKKELKPQRKIVSDEADHPLPAPSTHRYELRSKKH